MDILCASAISYCSSSFVLCSSSAATSHHQTATLINNPSDPMPSSRSELAASSAVQISAAVCHSLCSDRLLSPVARSSPPSAATSQPLHLSAAAAPSHFCPNPADAIRDFSMVQISPPSANPTTKNSAPNNVFSDISADFQGTYPSPDSVHSNFLSLDELVGFFLPQLPVHRLTLSTPDEYERGISNGASSFDTVVVADCNQHLQPCHDFRNYLKGAAADYINNAQFDQGLNVDSDIGQAYAIEGTRSPDTECSYDLYWMEEVD